MNWQQSLDQRDVKRLAEWIMRLGNPDTWFPKIILDHDPYHGERPDYSQLRSDLQDLQIACKSLLEKAKEPAP